jgi:hypothetical protein
VVRRRAQDRRDLQAPAPAAARAHRVAPVRRASARPAS